MKKTESMGKSMLFWKIVNQLAGQQAITMIFQL